MVADPSVAEVLLMCEGSAGYPLLVRDWRAPN